MVNRALTAHAMKTIHHERAFVPIRSLFKPSLRGPHIHYCASAGGSREPAQQIHKGPWMAIDQQTQTICPCCQYLLPTGSLFEPYPILYNLRVGVIFSRQGILWSLQACDVGKADTRHDSAGKWYEHVRTRGRFLGHERVAHPHPTDAINRVPTSHAMNCAKKMMDACLCDEQHTLSQAMTGKRCMKRMHVLCEKWQFIASHVGARFIAPASSGTRT